MKILTAIILTGFTLAACGEALSDYSGDHVINRKEADRPGHKG